MKAMSRRTFVYGAPLLALGAPASVLAQTRAAPPVTVFQNVRIFDGRRSTLSRPSSVLVRGNIIERIVSGTLSPERGAILVDGGGRTLMPGLIDAHVHMTLSTVPLALFMTADPNYNMLRQARAAGEMLMRGFTSARDLAGNSFGLKRAIDEGYALGPRIWPCGASISQTSGHGDFRTVHYLPRSPGDPLHFTERMGATLIADGVPEVLRRVREQLMLGASQIKMMAGGGIASSYDPLDVTQFTEAEIRAGVEATESWGTYVTVHAYTPRAIQLAIRAGVRCVDHGQLSDDATAKMMAQHGVWWCLQPFLDDEDAIPFPENSPQREKLLQVARGTEAAYALAKKFNVKTAWGTDTLFDARLAARQGAQLSKLVRWFSPADVLKMATSGNAELLGLSGPRNPYPGKLGVIEEGALADLLLVAGDPLADIRVIDDPARNFVLIMKDGKVHKNALNS